MSSSPLLPLTRESTSSLTLTRSTPPSRIRIGRFAPGHLSLTRRFSSPPPGSPTDETPTTLSGRLKLLIKNYGWYALGVYIVVGFLDFGLSFALINFIGADQVSKYTGELKAWINELLHRVDVDGPGNSVKDPATQSQNGNESLYAMIALAYTLHKTLFLPVRVGLVAGITPRFVKFLTARGWTGRAGSVRAANHMRDKMRQAGRGKDRMQE